MSAVRITAYGYSKETFLYRRAVQLHSSKAISMPSLTHDLTTSAISRSFNQLDIQENSYHISTCVVPVTVANVLKEAPG